MGMYDNGPHGLVETFKEAINPKRRIHVKTFRTEFNLKNEENVLAMVSGKFGFPTVSEHTIDKKQ